MDMLATRALSYTDDAGNIKELILKVFMPFEVKEYQWKCGFMTDPPIRSKIIYGAGIDFIQAIVECLRVVSIYFETVERSRRVHWQGMPDCGLPHIAEKPASFDSSNIPPPLKIEGSIDVLTTRAVGYREESGLEIQRRLTIFVPTQAEDGVWKCGFTFDSPPFASLRYGVGADFIEALLDGLANARAVFEATTPKRYEPLEGSFNCDYLPYKIGRSFWLDPLRESLLDPTDVSAG